MSATTHHSKIIPKKPMIGNRNTSLKITGLVFFQTARLATDAIAAKFNCNIIQATSTELSAGTKN
jgi:hypothetical protein